MFIVLQVLACQQPEEDLGQSDTGSSFDGRDEDEKVNIPSNVTGAFLTCAVREEWQESQQVQEMGCRLNQQSGEKLDLEPYAETWAYTPNELITQAVVDHPTWHVFYQIRGSSQAVVDQLVKDTEISLDLPIGDETLTFRSPMGSILQDIDLFNDPDVDVGPVGIDEERPGSL